MMARRQIERAQVGVLVLDAAQGVTSGDLAMAGLVWELGRAAVVAVNKWDLLDDEGRERLEAGWPRLAELLADPPRVNVSALTGRGVEKLFPAVDRALAALRPGSAPPSSTACSRRRWRAHDRPRSAASPGSSTTRPRCRARRRPSCCSPTAPCRGATPTAATSRTGCARPSTSPACRSGSSSASGRVLMDWKVALWPRV